MIHPIRNKQRRREYDRQRKAGWDCGRAKYAADALYVFRKLEDAGLVRFRVEPDDDTDLSFLDQNHYVSTREGRASAKAVRDMVERDGVWGVIAEYRIPFGREYDPDTGEGLTEWADADSIWSMFGDDADTSGPDRTGYLADMARECLKQFKAAYRAMLANNRRIA